MMKAVHVLWLFCILLTSCTTPPMPHEPPDTYPYALIPLPIKYTQIWYPEDQIQITQNGSIHIWRSQLHTQAQTYYLHQIYTSDGTCLTLDGCDTFRIAWETEEGTWILSAGKTAAVYDADWKLLENLERPVYAGYPLDGGRYYAVNDTYRQEYGFAVGVDGESNPELYALYRYTERLTDCCYTHIETCEDGFRCYTDPERTEFVLYEADDIVSLPEPAFTSVLDERTGYYYCIDKTGTRIPNKRFTYAFSPQGNTAVAWIYDKAYQITYAP